MGISYETFKWSAGKGYAVLGQDFIRYNIFDNSFKVQNYYEIPETKLYYETMAKWYNSGYIKKDIMSIQNFRQNEAKKDGAILWNHVCDDYTAKRDSVKAGFPITIIPLTKDFYQFSAGVSPGTSTAISRTSDNPKRAMQFLNLINSKKGKELYNMLTYGIEGEHYKKQSENRIETFEPEVAQSPTANNKYGLFKMAIGNTGNSYETQGDPEGWLEYAKKVNSEKVKTPLSELIINYDSVKVEIAQIQAVIGEFEPSLASGALSNYQEKYDEFIEKLKKAGIEKVLATVQKQVDEFIKNKK
jgi:putative aldouronate transport system substrate-binding protein